MGAFIPPRRSPSREGMEVWMRGVKWLLVGSVLVGLVAGPVGAHPTNLSDTVEPGSFQGEGREIHPATGAGEWCLEVTEVVGHVGQMSSSIRTAPLGEAVAWISGHPKVGKTYCTNRTVPAGDYSIGLIAFGGQPGSVLTVKVLHP